MKIVRLSRKWLLVIPLLLAVIMLAACSSSPPSTTAPSTSAAPTPTATSTPSRAPSPSPGTVATPSIEITSSGNRFGIGDLTISVKVSNFQLVNKLGQTNSPGEGHIHYFMDVDPPVIPGKPAVTAPGTYAATAETSYTWHNVNSGQHKFSVELANNDHTPLNPPVTATVSILVIPEIGPPAAVIVSPRDNAVVPAGNVTITAQATNFNLVDKLGQANVQREGHLHYFLDVEPPTTPGQPAVTAQGTYAATADTSYTWNNVPSGTHSFSIELVNNDHTPLDTPVVAKVTVNVTGSPTTTGTPAPVPSPTAAPGPSGQAVTIDLIAQNMAFDKSTISVPAGAAVTVNFNNKDGGIPHNFAVYQNLPGGQVKPIFIGDTISGPATITYHFTAPASSGDYFFECDVHPQSMNGPFVVTP